MTGVHRTWSLIAAAMMVSAAVPMALAEHDRAQKLHRNKDIVGLERILSTFRQRYPEGRVLEVELERESGQYIYELEILAPSGEVRELRLNAVNGDFLGEDTSGD
jgi:uncharacterized membrane protein YkoI